MSLKKTADLESPHAVFKNDQGWEWRVLKTYKKPENEVKDVYARWFVAAKSPMSFDQFELGDTYASEVRQYGTLVEATDEWKEAYALINVEGAYNG